MPPSIAIIGAGPGGVAAAYHLTRLVPGAELTVYERYDRVGGTFNVRENAGIDDDGLPVHSAAWPGMFTNSTSHSVEYSTCPMDIRPSTYLTSEQYRAYIERYADSHRVTPLIQFRKHVNKAWYDEDSKQFTLRITDLKDKKEDLVTYDCLVVASGRFTVPNNPTFDGEDTFPGTIIHSKDFKSSKMFQNKRVLMVGFISAGYILSQAMADQTEYEHISIIYRNKMNKAMEEISQNWKYPRFDIKCTSVKSIQGPTVHFEDGTSANYDVIIKGTGFSHEIPFLETNLQFGAELGGMLNDLYLGVLHRRNERLYFIGMSMVARGASMWELQAIAIAQLMTGVLNVPTEREMTRDVEERVESWMNAEPHGFGLVDKFNEYCAYLKQVTKDTTIQDEKMAKAFKSDFSVFLHDVRNFQGKTFPELDQLFDEG